MHHRTIPPTSRFLVPLVALAMTAAACDERQPPPPGANGHADPIDRPADAATTGALDAGDATLMRDYRLTMDGIRRYAQATENFQSAIAANPSLRGRLDAMDEAQDSDGLGSFVRLVDQVPEWRQAIRQAGLSTQDYAMVMATLTASALYVGMRQMGMDPPLDESISERNVALVEENWAEIEQLMQRTRALDEDHDDW